MALPKLSQDQAKKEFNEWLDSRRYPQARRDELEKDAAPILEGMQKGYIRLEDTDEGKAFVYDLAFPLKGEKPISCVKFHARIKAGEVTKAVKGTENDSGEGTTNLIARFTDLQSAPVVRILEVTDFTILGNIVQYFLQ